MPDALAMLAQFVAETKGPITRQKVITERNRLKAARKSHVSGTTSVGTPPATDAAAAPIDMVARATEATSGTAFNTVLIDLRNRLDIKNLDTDYVRGGEPAALKIGECLSHNALVVAIFRLGDVCTLAKKLEFWRKGRIDRLFLFKSMGSVDVTDEIAIAVCGNDTENRFSQLFFVSQSSSPLDVCIDVLNDDPSVKLQLFAETASPGWSALCGEDNWKTDIMNVVSAPPQ